MTKHIPEVIRELSRERAPRFYNSQKKIMPTNTVEVGQIWSTFSRLELPSLPETSTDEPRLVVILTGAGSISNKLEQVSVAPISVMTWAATDLDLLVPEAESSLTYRFMVEIWNQTPALKAHLRSYVGKLSEAALTALRSIHIARLVDEDLPPIVRAWTGVPLMGENDIRINFQRTEIEALEYLANVATAAIFAEVTEPVSAPTERQAVKRRFESVPRFGNLTDFLKAPKRALAATTITGDDMIIFYEDAQNLFVFQLLETRRESLVYLVVHGLSPNLEGQTGVVTLITDDGAIHSDPAELRKDAEVEIGRIKRFDRNKVRNVIVEVQEPR
jgi:hypothetical protein